MNELQKIAVLIDADNTQLSKIRDVLREVSTHGRIVVKRAYGNWQKEALKKWEAEMKQLAIKAVQQFDYVTGKNATDMALVIDTIELLYTKLYDAFVIISSDSDYTPLAIKLRESGVFVMGVGENKTPDSFKNACDEFLLLENIAQPTPAKEEAPAPASKAPEKSSSENKTKPAVKKKAAQQANGINEIHGLLKMAFDTYQDDDGFANIGPAGSFIKRAKPDFDSRTYGYKKLPDFLAAFPKKYEVQRIDKKGTTVISYRCLKK